MSRMTLLTSSTLNAARIEALALDPAAAVDITAVAETGSTNADLLAAVHDAPTMRPRLLVAQMQTAGRGRAGRVWHSAPDAALTFSLAWKFQCPVQQLAGLPLAVGATLAETLLGLGQPVQLKWPNDLLLGNAKLGGILIETVAHKTGLHTFAGTWAVIGIGLNLALPAALASQFGSADASALAALEREQLLATLLNALTTALIEFERDGFVAFAARWNAHHAYAGRPVKILDHGNIVHQGLAVGVDQAGRLLLDTDAGPIAVTAGDVSLRLQNEEERIGSN